MATADLTLADARRVLDGALAHAESIGQPMNVAVVDAAGHLITFARQDGAILASIDIATRKARTAALFRMSTAALGEEALPEGSLYGVEVTNGGLVVFGGGIPIADPQGRPAGAVGVSAGSVDQDTAVAQAGVDAY